MSLRVELYNRDFSTPPLKPYDYTIKKLTWSAFGGPDQAFLTTAALPDRLVEFSSLLRCPVLVTDEETIPVWWGYIDKITVYFEGSQFSLSLEDLYNRVKVRYAYLSPDNRLADQSTTAFADNVRSQDSFGVKEMVLYRKNIDDVYAENLRDVFLELYAWPRSVLAARSKQSQPYVQLRCSGWFKTLDWVSYENLEGFYGHQDTGPGSLPFGDATYAYPSQSFKPGVVVDVKYAYVKLRKVGSPTSDITAELRYNSGGNPGTVISTSNAVAGSGLASGYFQWVKFTFASAVNLPVTSYRYWLTINPNTSSSSNYYVIRTDYNTPYPLYSKVYTTSWIDIPALPLIGTRPTVLFRVVCVEDTGLTLYNMATAGNQFFSAIDTITTGVDTSQYRANGYSCLTEIKTLMSLGTANQRKILAAVDPQLRLRFYEQPSSSDLTVYMDRYGRFFSNSQKFIKPYFPPIGQYAMLSGVDRLVMPFDKLRAPTYFVDQASYMPGLSGK